MKNNKRSLKTLLRSVGVFHHYRGYDYFLMAISIASENPEKLSNIRKDIYLPISIQYKTDIQNVERDIRTIRNVVMRNNGAILLQEMTGGTFWEKNAPYPRELIEIFAEYLTEE